MATFNPLNDFNTFSYHHFLVLVNDSAVADKLDDAALFFRFVTGEAEIPGARVLINPIKNIRYVIQSMEWTNWLAMNYEEFGGTVGSGGEFKIIEPNGMGFMNDIFDAFNSLNCGISTSQWVLKTIFVGQTDVGGLGQSSVEYINNVNALRMVVVDMDASFTEAGGEYNFKFVAAASGAGLVAGGGATPFSSNASVNLAATDQTSVVTLDQALQQLEHHINETVKRDYEEIVAIHSLQTNPGPLPLKTQHKIIVDESLKKPEYIIKVPKRQGAGPDGTAPVLAVQVGTTMPVAISRLIKMCEQLLIESATEGQQREHYVDTAEVLDSTTQTKTFMYYVKERAIEPIRKPAAKDGGTNTGDLPPAEQKSKESGNYLEFDYLYTGKNLDVLSYEMKLGEGLAFLSAMANFNLAKDDRSHKTKAEHATSAANMSEVMSGRAQPHQPSALAKAEATHSTNPSAVSAYEQLLQQHTVLKMMATLRIRGNPRLLNDIIPTINANGETNINTKLGVAANYGTQPMRCRVNVRMPKNGDPNELQDFWYKGSFLILSVTNTFASGEFTQELQMVVENTGEFNVIPEPPPPVPPAKDVFEALPLEPSVMEARVRAFLATIRYCEGTTGESGYTTLFGYSQFTGFEDHPRTVIKTPSYQSSAAGAYQIIAPTWDTTLSSAKYKPRLPDFSPVSQDIAGWCLLDYRKALPAIRAGRVTEALYLCRKEWASLPHASYGQPTKKLEEVLNVYNEYLQQEMNGQTTLKAPQGVLV